jgi:hypothetical protein
MLLFDGGLALIAFAVWIFCIIDVITTPPDACRNLPKLAWLIVVVLLIDVGSIVWLVAGHNWARQPAGVAQQGSRGRVPARATNPDDDEEFLAELRARAEEQRRRAREAQRRDEPPADQPPSP